MNNISNLTNELYSSISISSLAKIMSILPNPDKILRKTGKTIDAYRDLKNDAHVWSCIQSRKSGLVSLDNDIIPNGASEAIVREIVNIFNNLDIQQIERDILEAPLFGYQPFEIVWDITNECRKLIFPKKIIAKPQEWFFYDNEGSLRFKKYGMPEGVLPPQMKIINVQYEPSYLNPYGHSLLSKCYWLVTFKNGGLKFWVSFAERYGMPILMGRYTRGVTSEEAQRLADELAKMTEDAVIVTPSDINIELHEANKTTSVELYHELIKYCNTEISKAILSQTLTTEIDEGSYAAAQVHYKVRMEVILSDIKLVESFFNKIIKYIIDLNFTGSAYPKFKIIMNDADNQQKIDRDIKLCGSGYVKFTKKYFMDTYGFKADEIEI